MGDLMIDSHVHADTRPYEDFELMATVFDCVITHAHDPLKMRSFDVALDYFDKILGNEIAKARKNGLKMKACIGIHPRAIPPKIDYNVLKEYLKKENVVGVGEIGLEKCSKEEIEVFENQITIAREMDLPAVVHTPRTNKEAVTKNIIEVLDTMDLPIDFKKKIVIEHVTKETVPIIWENDYKLGITVQPQKLTPNDAVEILGEYCEKRFLLNSDSSSAPSDILGVPKTVLKLKMAGFDEKVINAVSHNNAVDLFKIN